MRSWTFHPRVRGRWPVYLYLHILDPKIDSDGCPLREWEWNIQIGNRMFGGESYWSEARPRRRGA